MTTNGVISEALLDRLSAYVDGELPPGEMAEIEALAAEDAGVRAEIAALRALDIDIAAAFEADLADPPAIELPEMAMPAQAANENAPPASWWRSIAAALVFLAIGAGAGGLGVWTMRPEAPVQMARGWLDNVADYHRVYAAQGRHLVEVAADERDHIETWLAATTGVEFTTPDLASFGFEYRGARLLVAAGRPVIQLIYTNEAGAVVAICAIDRGGDGAVNPISPRDFGDITMATWSTPDAAYVVVGPENVDLTPIAEQVSTEI
ncbi:MAG: anti-sigma factor [Pseudomonadota bacterium]